MNERRSLNGIHLFIVLIMLIVEICFERQLRSASAALEASSVEEREVLERADSVDLVNDLFAPEASWLVEIGSIHLQSSSHFSLNSILFLLFYLLISQQTNFNFDFHLDHHYFEFHWRSVRLLLHNKTYANIFFAVFFFSPSTWFFGFTTYDELSSIIIKHKPQSIKRNERFEHHQTSKPISAWDPFGLANISKQLADRENHHQLNKSRLIAMKSAARLFPIVIQLVRSRFPRRFSVEAAPTTCDRTVEMKRRVSCFLFDIDRVIRF